MREKAGEAVPDKIKEMVQSHDNDMNAEVYCQCFVMTAVNEDLCL